MQAVGTKTAPACILLMIPFSRPGRLFPSVFPDIIGSVYVKDYGNAKVANISIATGYCYTSKDGQAVIETTLHYVTAWEGREIQNLGQLKKGSFIHIIGRLRNRKYVAADGTERIAYDIIASNVELM